MYKGQKRKVQLTWTHPRDGSLSVSNPTRTLDTLSDYHGDWGQYTGKKHCTNSLVVRQSMLNSGMNNLNANKRISHKRVTLGSPGSTAQTPLFVRQSTSNSNEQIQF